MLKWHSHPVSRCSFLLQPLQWSTDRPVRLPHQFARHRVSVLSQWRGTNDHVSPDRFSLADHYHSCPWRGKDLRCFLPGTLNNNFYWLFQLDDSKPLHIKWMFNHAAIKKHWCFGYQVYVIFVFAVWNNSHDKTSFGSILWEESCQAKNEQRRSGNKQATGTNCLKQISKCGDLLHIISMRQPFFPKPKEKKKHLQRSCSIPKSLIWREKKPQPNLKQASCKVRSLKLTFHLPPSTCTKSLAPLPFRKFISAASNLGWSLRRNGTQPVLQIRASPFFWGNSWQKNTKTSIGWLFGSSKNKGCASIVRLSELLTT